MGGNYGNKGKNDNGKNKQIQMDNRKGFNNEGSMITLEKFKEILEVL